MAAMASPAALPVLQASNGHGNWDLMQTLLCGSACNVPRGNTDHLWNLVPSILPQRASTPIILVTVAGYYAEQPEAQCCGPQYFCLGVGFGGSPYCGARPRVRVRIRFKGKLQARVGARAIR